KNENHNRTTRKSRCLPRRHRLVPSHIRRGLRDRRIHTCPADRSPHGPERPSVSWLGRLRWVDPSAFDVEMGPALGGPARRGPALGGPAGGEPERSGPEQGGPEQGGPD